MSEIREKARRWLDKELPVGAGYPSKGPGSDRFTKLTNWTQTGLEEAWGKPKTAHLSTCMEFVGVYSVSIGAKQSLGTFFLKDLMKKLKKSEAWIDSADGLRPKYGDILRHTKFHIDVALDFQDDILVRAASGQGDLSQPIGKRFDIVKRVVGSGPYDWKSLEGWVDIEIFFGESAGQSTSLPNWLNEWWVISDGSETYYYFFHKFGFVYYTKSRPMSFYTPPSNKFNEGVVSFEPSKAITIKWNDGSLAREVFVPDDWAKPTRMTGRYDGYQASPPFSAELLF